MRQSRQRGKARGTLLRAAAAAVMSSVLLLTGCEFDIVDRGSDNGGSPTSGPEDPPAAEEAGVDGDHPGALLLIMDASGSMNATDDSGRTLLDGAKQALHDLVEDLPQEQHVGLRVYGHRVPNTDRENGCQDTELIHPVSPLDRPALHEAIDGFDAVGFTPIGLSLQEAANDLPPEGTRTVILVSDGEDTCAPPEPCDVAAEIAADGIDLIIHTVGFALGDNDQARTELECIADAGGGEFRDVEDAEGLGPALEDSARDPREADLDGAELVGAPLPRDAATGQVNTRYVDTVLGDEDNFYRFEVVPGSSIRAEVNLRYEESAVVEGCTRHSTRIHLTDAGADRYPQEGRFQTVGTSAGDVSVHHTNTFELNASEVWIKIEGRNDDCARAELQVELQLAVE